MVEQALHPQGGLSPSPLDYSVRLASNSDRKVANISWPCFAWTPT